MRLLISENDKLNPEFLHLSFVQDGKLVSEYIPKAPYRFESWLFQKKNDFLMDRNLDIYYYDLRHLLSPLALKQEDISFLIHVITVHDGVPTIQKELKHFKKIKSLYSLELESLIQPLHEMSISKKRVKIDPYAEAYRKKWLVKKPDPEWSRLYHGVKRDELPELLLMKANEIRNRCK